MGGLVITSAQGRKRQAAKLDRKGAAARKIPQQIEGDVGDRVAEAVEPDDLSLHQVAVDARKEAARRSRPVIVRAEFRRGGAQRQVGRGRGKDIAAVKCGAHACPSSPVFAIS